MARFFHYKTPDALTSEATRLGHTLSLSQRYEPLFQPIAIGSKRCGNRLAIQPMEGCDGTLDGRPDELTFRRYVRFGSGGAKLIWGEATAISDEAVRESSSALALRPNGRVDRGHAEPLPPRHREACGNADDLVIGLQLTHSGRYGYRRTLLVSHDPLRDPLTIDKVRGRPVDGSFPLAADDELAPSPTNTSPRHAWRPGWGLTSSTSSSVTAICSRSCWPPESAGPIRREFENRTRLIREVVARIREEIPSLIVATRFNAYDGIAYRKGAVGAAGEPCRTACRLKTASAPTTTDHRIEDLAEPLELARYPRNSGVGLLNVTAGTPTSIRTCPAGRLSADRRLRRAGHPLLGVLRHFRLARAVQAAVPDLPVVGSGYSWLQEFALQAAAANVADGSVAIVGLGRATLAQPDLRNLEERGGLDHRRTCRTFSYCTNLMRNRDHPAGQFPTGCPPFDKEIYGPIWKEAQRKLPPGDSLCP